jgi:hypothetical protein
MAPALKERVIKFHKPFRITLRPNGDGEIIPEVSDDIYTSVLLDLNSNEVNMFDVRPGDQYLIADDHFTYHIGPKKIVTCVGFVVHKIEETDVLRQNATATFYYVSP